MLPVSICVIYTGFCIILDSMSLLKSLKFLGGSHDDLCAFPQEVRHAVGVDLMVVQFGGVPSDFKPMPGVGADQ